MLLQRLLGSFRIAYLPVLVTYFAYGASAITGVALLYLQKTTLDLTPAEVAHVGFWAGLPWATKMVAGAASDRFPLFGSRRRPYLFLGAVLSMLGYAALATAVDSKSAYLGATVIIALGFMIQDVVADALSVEVARSEEETAQIQTLGRMALLVGSISVGYLSGVLAESLGPRRVCALATALPGLVAVVALLVRGAERTDSARGGGALTGHHAETIMLIGLLYAGLSVLLEWFEVPRAQELILILSGVLIALLLRQVGISRPVVVAAGVIFLFRSTPGVGQGYSYWAIDGLGFDERFLGLLAQVSSVLSLLGLVVFRRAITTRPVSVTLSWVIVAGTVLYLPNIGLFYGLHEWLGVTARTLAFIDTTISAPLNQLTMVPMLVLIAKTAPRGAEATMFAIMASLMNLALSASELFTRYLNTAFAVTQQDYSNLGKLMVTVLFLGLLPLLAIPLLRRHESLLHGEHAQA